MKKNIFFSFLIVCLLTSCGRSKKSSSINSEPNTKETLIIQEEQFKKSSSINSVPNTKESYTSNSDTGSMLDNSKFSSAMNKLAKEGHDRLQDSRSNRDNTQSWISGKSYSSVYCFDSHPCPWSEGVGMISLDEGNCVATLIEKDVIVTASHCLSNYENGDNVNGAFSLPGFSRDGRKISFEIIPLKMLIAKSGSAHNSVDFAFVRLHKEAKEHSPVKVSREGFLDGETYLTIGKDLLESSPTFKQWNLRDTCYSTYRNAISPHYNHKNDPFVALSNCPIGAGNSGAPILNKKNELVGIVRGHINMSIYIFTHQYLLYHGFIKHDNSIFLAGATNFACMPDVLEGKPLVSTNCDQSGAENLQVDNSNDKTLDNLILPKLEKLVDSGTFKRSSSATVAFRTTYIWTPDCIDSTSLKKLGERTYLETVLYSPLVNEKFKITSELSEPFEAIMFIEEDSSSGEGVFKAKVEVAKGFSIYEGKIQKCDN